MELFPPETLIGGSDLCSGALLIKISLSTMNVLLSFSLIVIGICSMVVDGSVCEQCKSPVVKPSPVQERCNGTHLSLTDNHRCCVNTTAGNGTDTSIVGVDMRNCSLNNVTGLFKDLTSLVTISLDDNPLTSLAAEDFYELTQLDYLSLSAASKKAMKCPGGLGAWHKVTFKDSTLVCQDQVDACFSRENDTCPSPESYCTPAGPGLVDCLCSPGYHGYKCLRQGTFPLAPFVGGICGSTVALSIFLWITQRRNVKKHTS